MLHFIRHGQTDANLNKQNAGGEWDIPLNETGRKQTKEFADQNPDFLKSIDVFYVSPMIRAQQTADIIRKNLSHPYQRETIEGLREWRLGQWSKLQYSETPDYFGELLSPPGGEPYLKFESRVLDTLRQLAARQNERALVIAHGGVWFAYARYVGHENKSIENCRCEEIQRDKLMLTPSIQSGS